MFHPVPSNLTSRIGSLCAGVILLLTATMTMAQERTTLLDHRAPTGVAGRWSALTRPGIAGLPQPVKISLPSTGQISFFPGSPLNEAAVPAPALAGLGVGYVYRVKITNMPEFPGVELYPTIELLDRLHPPAGLELEFPVPVQITESEIETVLKDQMVTKVVYLEQPDLAFPVTQTAGARIENLPPTENLLQAADLRGRPMVIVRIGGRIPDPNSPKDEFFSQSPLQILKPQP
ncbi:MAG TPA: hypothetical protein VNQ76_22510 [Planctomicrobium sp.]|nr:hypothetical protein [Planctomicrobium sp.]